MGKLLSFFTGVLITLWLFVTVDVYPTEQAMINKCKEIDGSLFTYDLTSFNCKLDKGIVVKLIRKDYFSK